MPPTPQQISTGLCLDCSLCCNGTLFQDVQLLPGEAAGPLKALGLPVVRRGRKYCFDQPCPALRGARCEVYATRPSHCRAFECLLFQSVQRGEATMPKARSQIRATLIQLGKIRDLFERLGDRNDGTALRRRFLVLSRRMEASPLEADKSPLFSELTLAFHNLNLQLQEYFIP